MLWPKGKHMTKGIKDHICSEGEPGKSTQIGCTFFISLSKFSLRTAHVRLVHPSKHVEPGHMSQYPMQNLFEKIPSQVNPKNHNVHLGF